MTEPHNKISAPPREAIESLYVGEQLSLTETAARFGVSISPLQRWMREMGIPIRSVRDARFVAKKHVYSEETLERMRNRAERMRELVTPEANKKGAQKRRGRPAHNRGKPASEETKAKMRALRADPEYRRHMSELNKGANSHRWKGGTSKSDHERHLDTAEWRRIRKVVYARDGWTCQDCGVMTLNFRDSRANPKRRVQAHHILPRRQGGGDELENLVTLCMSCHHKREAKFR